MCGIAGFCLPRGAKGSGDEVATSERLVAMARSLLHRGPDAQRGVVLDGVALAHTRLAVVDVACGSQPMRDAESGVCVVFNGEIFNHVELRDELDAYTFRTRSDTEVILAAYLKWGMACVNRFIGQWAFALWDPRDRALHLSRDRFGVRPLHYVATPDGMAFASEIKALFAGGFVVPRLDPCAIKETACLWTTVAPRTAFQSVYALPPGCNAVVRDRRIQVDRYWSLDLDDERVDPTLTTERAMPAVAALLDDAVRLRLRADVPVGAYLSGGLDSALICALAQRRLRDSGRSLSTYSVSFDDARYDERAYQHEVAAGLATDHHEVRMDDPSIGALLPEVVRLAEQPIVRSAPAPLLALSRLVRDHRTKVVLTGEGADEIFWGYELFQETAIRRFWSRQPASNWRFTLFQRIYPYLRLSEQRPSLVKQFYGLGVDDPAHPAFSHLLRWTSTSRVWNFFAPGFREAVRCHDPVANLLDTLPPAFSRWRALARAQHLEMTTLLGGYLLSAQGDRMLMGNSVEGRFPFLDHRVAELAARLPDSVKLHVLREKRVCKRIAADLVPPSVVARPKTPYRAPVAGPLLRTGATAWVDEVLDRSAVDDTGVFDPSKTDRLRRKLSDGQAGASESDGMALMVIASVQLLHQQFIAGRDGVRIPHVPVHMVCAERCNAGVA